jgi:hypothetical protein
MAKTPNPLRPIRAHFVEDPGHGWLRVSVDDVRRVDAFTGVAARITSYSYLSPNWAFFEEDCDAGEFLNAAKAAGITVQMAPSTHSEKPATCRSYGAFSARKLHTDVVVGAAFNCPTAAAQNPMTVTQVPGAGSRSKMVHLTGVTGMLFGVPLSQFWDRMRPLDA